MLDCVNFGTTTYAKITYREQNKLIKLSHKIRKSTFAYILLWNSSLHVRTEYRESIVDGILFCVKDQKITGYDHRRTKLFYLAA